MKTLITTEFFVSVMSLAENQTSDFSVENLSKHYDDFQNALTALRIKVMNKPELMRCLDYARIELMAMENILEGGVGHNKKALLYCIKARNLIDCELRILQLSLSYPHFCTEQDKVFVSPLFWSNKYTKTDLIEILTALSSAGAITQGNGSPAQMSVIVRVFETVFNMKIRNADTMKWYAVNRKVKLTNFIDTLKGIMVDLSRQ